MSGEIALRSDLVHGLGANLDCIVEICASHDQRWGHLDCGNAIGAHHHAELAHPIHNLLDCVIRERGFGFSIRRKVHRVPVARPPDVTNDGMLAHRFL